MDAAGFEPREGGVKIVFDAREADAEALARAIASAAFDVTPYYHPDDEHGPGRSAPGWIRLGAERSAHEFTDAEQDRIVAAFDRALATSGFACNRVGTDVWTAGGGEGRGGVREPRRPHPRAGAGAAAAPVPPPAVPGIG